jgi:hypothetical protein
MFKTTLLRFMELRSPVKAMLYLHWTYSMVLALTGMFVNIYLYQRFRSVEFNAIAQAINFVGVALGFSLVGAIAAYYRMNMKWGYAWAFFALCGSFLFLFGQVTRMDAVWFMFTNGFGLGLYWLTLHTFELTETKNHERDHYSSFLSAGDQVIDLAAPACATLLFFISGDLLQWGSYTLLFIISPLIYLCGVPFIGRIRTYRPQPIDREDVRHFFGDKKNRLSQIYYLAGSGSFAFARVGIPIASIFFFGTEKQVGLWNILFAVLSAFSVLVLSHHRNVGNRLRFLFITTACSALAALLIGVWYTFAAFLIYSLASIILKPLLRVSSHVIDLETMETLGRKEKDFFATMIFRDVAFGFWRVLCLLLFAFLIHLLGEGEFAVRMSFIGLAGSTLLLYYGATLLYRTN